jgi:hypothetical protein
MFLSSVVVSLLDERGERPVTPGRCRAGSARDAADRPAAEDIDLLDYIAEFNRSAAERPRKYSEPHEALRGFGH